VKNYYTFDKGVYNVLAFDVVPDGAGTPGVITVAEVFSHLTPITARDKMSILYCPLLTTLPQSAIDLPCEGGSAARYVPVNGWNPMPEHYSHSSFANMSELTVLDPRYARAPATIARTCFSFARHDGLQQQALSA
jgi:hypothetical protein